MTLQNIFCTHYCIGIFPLTVHADISKESKLIRESPWSYNVYLLCLMFC